MISETLGLLLFMMLAVRLAKDIEDKDEAGTPFGITVDHDTLEDSTVTLRDRDTMKQERISIDKIIDIIAKIIVNLDYRLLYKAANNYEACLFKDY